MPSVPELLGLLFVILAVVVFVKVARLAIRLILFVVTVVIIAAAAWWLFVR